MVENFDSIIIIEKTCGDNPDTPGYFEGFFQAIILL
jgi:hypothetical protein